jgi:AraC-like DNA-binding protein
MLRYLGRWRTTIAAGLLRESDLKLAAVAERVGYGSEFAFAKAFKRDFGVAPGAYRRQLAA